MHLVFKLVMNGYKKFFKYAATVLYAFFTLWWLYLFIFVDVESEQRNYFIDSYGIIAGFGGIVGLYVSRKWSGFKSYVGRSIIFLSLGLLDQFLGQFSYSLEFYMTGEANYPSFGEIFYFTSIPFYIFGVWNIAKASGINISLKKLKNKIGAILFPLFMMGVSYFLFVRGTDFSEIPFLESVLTFAYPLGQATFVSLALLTYVLTDKVLGGVMKGRVIFILFALIFQYAADTTFLYETIQDIWYPADIADFMFATSYFLMTMAFIRFLNAFDKLKKPD